MLLGDHIYAAQALYKRNFWLVSVYIVYCHLTHVSLLLCESHSLVYEVKLPASHFSFAGTMLLPNRQHTQLVCDKRFVIQICITECTISWMYKTQYLTLTEIIELTVCCHTTCFSAFPQLAEGTWPLPLSGFLQFSSTLTDLSRCRNPEIYSCLLFMTS